VTLSIQRRAGNGVVLHRGRETPSSKFYAFDASTGAQKSQ
jgi:hypothetical protein